MRKTQSFPSYLLLAAFVLVSSCTRLHAQYENGSLVGTIRDASGAPIVGAAVKTTNNDTANIFESKTNASGDYEVLSLRVGVYTVTASASGFSGATAQKLPSPLKTASASTSR